MARDSSDAKIKRDWRHLHPREKIMKHLFFALVLTSWILSACGTDARCPTRPPSNASETSESADPSAEVTPPSDTTEDSDAEWPGSSATSCGSPDQGLEPVDCTMHGDTDAFCVYSNHCYCTADAGFQCEAPLMGDWQECAPGSTCVPIET